MKEDNKYLAEDEIDLRELFKTIWEKKVFIISFTMIVTITSIIYVLLKNPIPIYQGKAYIEIGQIQNKNFEPTVIEDANDIAKIITMEFGVEASLIKGTTKILEVSVDNKNKDLIRETLNKIKDFTIERHKNLSSFYENVILSKQIGNIEILAESINKPKKTLIIVVAFTTGFILSIFLVFFMQFIAGMRKEEK